MTPTAPAVLPHNLEAEESVLGAILLSQSALGVVTETLVAEDFYRPSYAAIYKAILQLDKEGEPVDAITLTDKLDELGILEEIGGSSRIAELAYLVPAASNVGHYAQIVKEMSTLRQLAEAGHRIAQSVYSREGEASELADRAEQMLFSISQRRSRTDFSYFPDLVDESFAHATKLYRGEIETAGLSTGFSEVDELTTGLYPGNLIILAARPSMGKSALAIQIATNACQSEVPVALFTLEMSKQEVTHRIICAEAKVESQRLRTGQLTQEDWDRLTGVGGALSNMPLYVDDSGASTVMDVRAKARRLKTQRPKMGLIIVDYVQLMIGDGAPENRVQELSQISRALKVLARELEIPVLMLSQLSRKVEQRHDRRPMLSDLRDSGSLEQDADLVFFIYRDDYYTGEESERAGVAELILAKNRNGPTGEASLLFLRRYAKFVDGIKEKV